MGEAAPIVSGLDSDSALFHRRIEFHAARKPFNGFGNNSSNGFKLVTLNPNSESHKASGSGKKGDKPEHPEIGLDPELSFEISFRRIGAGLRNLGNTCFLNSVLQCLTYTEPLAAYLQSGKHQSSCRTSGFCALCAIQKHVSRALQSTGRILEPKDLVSNLRCISRNFRNARQEDAHEYMVNLLESMHKCCLPSGLPSESPSAYEKSLVHKIFGGRLRSQVKCMQCSFCSNKFDPFLDLSLEIVKADSLRKALAHFTAKEQLDGGAKQYQCQQCKQKVKALKQLTIHKAPYVLTVHLKRFGSHVPGQKIDKKIAFEPTLDLKPYVTGPYDGDLKYTLYGVLVHAGWSTHSGHYYCFVRTSSGMWYSLDDNQVVQVNERKVLEQKAYMLFYVRDRRSFPTKKSVDVVHKEKIVMNAVGNAAYSKFNLELKEKGQNGSIEKKLEGFFSAPLSVKDAQVTTAPREIPSKKMSSQNADGKMDEREDHSTIDVNSVGRKGESCSTVEVSGCTAAKDVPCNNSFSVTADKKPSMGLFPDCNVPQDSLQKKGSSDVVIPSACYKDHPKENPNESTQRQNSSVLCPSSGTRAKWMAPILKWKTGDKETHGDGRRMRGVRSKLSSSPATGEHLCLGIAETKRPELKVKRKMFKYQVAAMSLSSNIIFGARFCMRKKTHKQRKRSCQRKNSTTRKHVLGGNDLPSDLGPSVSDASSPTHSQKKKAECGSDVDNQNLGDKNTGGKGRTSSNGINNEFRDRVVPDGTTLSAEKQPPVMQSAASEGYTREMRQTGLMSILTRGLEETTGKKYFK
ncbi:UNVERIFIED_CONTAM: Ubiquitin carboxyl-terminal hydrolase 23 [Sesamum angustifolium]|uniref:Ubiquitin carboxyl-terminal hydrolase n=1 Tax=Sesamum angustifolium TaxID=2727405 RepID=A0AAW2IWB8_9LAMI